MIYFLVFLLVVSAVANYIGFAKLDALRVQFVFMRMERDKANERANHYQTAWLEQLKRRDQIEQLPVLQVAPQLRNATRPTRPRARRWK